MENKYYTPEIEEFHIGFEYQEFIPVLEKKFGSKVYVNKWKTTTLKSLSTAHSYTVEIRKDDGRIRVKYLDKEDMESLGWKYDECENKCLSLVKGIWDMWVYKDYLKIESEETGTIFRGDIKNKSELKILLKQLNIDEN
jgi:hypothetical protein